MNNSTALVTGANKGIGKEIARQLVAAGFTVHVGSRDADRGRHAVEEIRDAARSRHTVEEIRDAERLTLAANEIRDAEHGGRAGGDARLLVLDVTDGTSIADAARQIDDLDVLVNNAGILVDSTTPVEADIDSFRRTYETNLFGVLAVTNAFLPALRRSAKPRIVNISSGTGSLTWSAGRQSQFPETGLGAAYRSSKTALNALTLFYAQALAADGFKVNALAPGLRRTDLNPRAAASDGDPAEAAAAAVRLALLPDDGPTGKFLSWDDTEAPW